MRFLFLLPPGSATIYKSLERLLSFSKTTSSVYFHYDKNNCMPSLIYLSKHFKKYLQFICLQQTDAAIAHFDNSFKFQRLFYILRNKPVTSLHAQDNTIRLRATIKMSFLNSIPFLQDVKFGNVFCLVRKPP